MTVGKVKRTNGKTKNAHAGVNVVRSCGLLNQIMSMGKQTMSAKLT